MNNFFNFSEVNLNDFIEDRDVEVEVGDEYYSSEDDDTEEEEQGCLVVNIGLLCLPWSSLGSYFPSSYHLSILDC